MLGDHCTNQRICGWEISVKNKLHNGRGQQSSGEDKGEAEKPLKWSVWILNACSFLLLVSVFNLLEVHV